MCCLLVQKFAFADIFDTMSYLEASVLNPLEVDKNKHYPNIEVMEFFSNGKWEEMYQNTFSYVFNKDGTLYSAEKQGGATTTSCTRFYVDKKYQQVDRIIRIVEGNTTTDSVKIEYRESSIIEHYTRNNAFEKDVVYTLNDEGKIIQISYYNSLVDKTNRTNIMVYYDNDGRLLCVEKLNSDSGKPDAIITYTYNKNTITVNKEFSKDIITFEGAKVISKLTETPYGKYYHFIRKYEYDQQDRLISIEILRSDDDSLVLKPFQRSQFYYENLESTD